MTLNCTNINLKKGSKGETVKTIQKILKNKGYYTRSIDGDYGKYTEEAVKSLQKAQGNTADGVFGPKTCKKYNESLTTTEKTQTQTTTTVETTTLQKGSKGETVKTIQTKLQQLGYYNNKIDGEYGTQTTNAVKTYQHYYNLKNDGIAGPITQKALQNTQILKETSNSKRLSKALGITIKDHGTLYTGVQKKGKYKYYFNDIYTYTQEIVRIEKGQGINCTDWAQMGMWTLIDMGFKKEHIRIVRGVVTCSNEKATGHVWLQLYLNGKWINYDLSAAADHGYDMPKLICNTKPAYITNINPAWAVSDDGKT